MLTANWGKAKLRPETALARCFNPELLDSFEFSIRTSNCLQRGFVEDNPGEREGYATLAWLLTKSAPELLRIYNFGRRSLNEVKEALAQRGLHLRKD